MTMGTLKFETTTLAKRPAASAYANGFVIISDSSNALHYSDGTTWTSYSGGGGGSSTTAVTTVAASGASQAIAFPASGSAAYDVTLTANCTFTLTGGTAAQLQTVTLILRQDATAGRVATLPAGVKWPGGVAPTPNTTAGNVDVFTFTTPDAGTTILGNY